MDGHSPPLTSNSISLASSQLRGVTAVTPEQSALQRRLPVIVSQTLRWLVPRWQLLPALLPRIMALRPVNLLMITAITVIIPLYYRGYHMVTVVFRYRLFVFAEMSYYRLHLPSTFHRLAPPLCHYPGFTLLNKPSSNYRCIAVPTRPLPGYLVAYHIYRLITAARYYRPDHWRVASVLNKFTVKLQPPCASDAAIAEGFPTEQIYRQLTSVFYDGYISCRLICHFRGNP